MSEIKLILIRHGEAASAFGESEDPSLSALGTKQSKKLVKDLNIDVLNKYKFFSSPKARAIQTAKPLVDILKKDLIVKKEFSEIPAPKIDSKEKQRWLKNIMSLPIDKLPKDVNLWRQNLLKVMSSLEKNTIVFTHFMVINALIGYIVKNKTLLYFYPANASVTKVFLKNGTPSSYQVGENKKTFINL